MLKHIITAAACLMAVPAAAEVESFNLSRHGEWSVQLNVGDLTQWCEIASNSKTTGNRVAFSVTDDYRVFMQMFVNASVRPGVTRVNVDIQVGNSQWNLSEVVVLVFNAETVMLNFEFPREAVADAFGDLAAGNRVVLYIEDDPLPTEVWSLTGSAAALTALKECARRISETF